MLMPLLAVVGGIILLVYSADKFVEGAAATAKRFNWPPLLIGNPLSPELTNQGWAQAHALVSLVPGMGHQQMPGIGDFATLI